jgi:GNAT superfamily N-acetyltransferase
MRTVLAMSARVTTPTDKLGRHALGPGPRSTIRPKALAAAPLAGDDRAMPLAHARRLWTELAGAQASFAAPPSAARAEAALTENPVSEAAVLQVALAPACELCPPGWVGIVTIGDGAIVTAPDAVAAAALRVALAGLSITELTDPDVLTVRLRPTAPVLDRLGPASLAYLAAADFRPPTRPEAAQGGLSAAVEQIPADNPGVRALLDVVGAADAGECGLADVTSSVFALREDGGPDGSRRIVAAAGYEDWPAEVAHLSVLTAPAWRGRGLARMVAAAAVAQALREGRLPQWRARPAASRRVAVSLGFAELGAQLSLRLAKPRVESEAKSGE